MERSGNQHDRLADSLAEVMDARHSCRGFLDRAIPDELLDRLLGLAQSSPSWCNTQPWGIVLVTGETLEQLRVDFPRHVASTQGEPDIPFPERYEGDYLARRREAGWKLYEAVGIEKGDRLASGVQMLENFRFFGAPALVILTAPAELGTYGAVDCGVYVGQFMLAAQALGLGTIAQAALAAYSPFLRERLDIPADRTIVVGISFGFEDHSHPANNFRTSRVSPGTALVRYS